AARGFQRALRHPEAGDRRAAGAHRDCPPDARRSVRQAGGRMRKILLVAGREFIAMVSTKAFIIGLLIIPVMMASLAIIMPRVINPRNSRTEGEVAVIDPSGAAIADIRAAFSPQRMAERREEQARQLFNQAPAAVREIATAGPGQAAAAAAI